MTTVVGDGNCMLHAIFRSLLFQNLFKNHHVLKQCSFADTSMLQKFITDFCQHCCDDSLVHKFIDAKAPCVARGAACKSEEAIINRIRVEGSWLSDDLTHSLLRIELLIDIIVISNHW